MSQVVGEAVVKFRTDTTGVNPAKEGEVAGKKYSSGVLSGTKKLAAGLAGAFAAEKVGEFLKGSVDAASADEAAQRRLELALKNTTGATDDQIKGVDDWITKQSEATGLSKDDLIPAFQQLAQSTGSVSKAQKEMKIAMDVSAGTGKDLGVVSAALMKANNGTTASLSRLGLKTKQTVPDTQALYKAQTAVKQAQLAYTEAVKAHGVHSDEAVIAQRKVAEAQQAVGAAQDKTKSTTLTLDQALHKMSDTFGGQAAAKAQSFDGTVQRLHTTFHEFEVQVGTALIPILQSLANFLLKDAIPTLAKFGGWIKQNGTWLKPFAAIIAGLVIGFKIYTTSLKVITALQAAWATVLGTSTAATGEAAAAEGELDAAMDANPIGLVIVAVAALAAGFIYAYTHSEKFRNIVNSVVDTIKKYAIPAFHTMADFLTKKVPAAFQAVVAAVASTIAWVRDHWPLLLAIITGPIGLATLFIVRHWDQIKGGATDAVQWIKDKFDGLVTFIGSLPGKIGHAAKGMFDGIMNAYKAAINWIIDKWNGLSFTLPSVNTHIPGVGKVGGFTLSTPDIPRLASGSDNFAGGFARVGEEGPENVWMPPGSRVWTARDSAAGAGAQAGIYIASQTVVAHDYHDFVAQQRRTSQQAALGGRRGSR